MDLNGKKTESIKKEKFLKNIKNGLVTRIAYFGMKISEKNILRERMLSIMKLLQCNCGSMDLNTVLEDMGRMCCQKYKITDSAKKHTGNPQYFLDTITKFTIWDEYANYDKENGILKIIGIKRKKCVCPFAKLLHPQYVICDTCCVGFQKELFETLFNRSVNVKVDETLLKGNHRCSYTISFN